MLAMDKINDIRERFYRKGEGISQIANEFHLDWKTVRKYVDMADFNEPASDKCFCPKLDPYKSTIDKWLVGENNRLRESSINDLYRSIASADKKEDK